MFDHVLASRNERVTIVGATSGDTGSAAIDGVAGCEHVDIVILYPYGRTSEVQRRQMTTVDQPNVHAVAVEGTFDDCQDLVKAMFNDAPFRERNRLSAVNSINWARVMAQTVYYVIAAEALNGPLTFSVPTGNFGNVLAGWIAREMGAPIDDFVIASNTNDILTRFVNDGDMTTRDVIPTLSPSMDIQVSSNFERLLFEMNGRDGGMTTEQLGRFRATGRLDIEADQRAEYITGSFRATSFDDAATIAEMRRTQRATGMVLDPHSATGVAAARQFAAGDGPSCRWRPPIRRSSPTPSRRPPGAVPNFPSISPICWSAPSARRRWPTSSARSSDWSNNCSAADVASNGGTGLTCRLLGSSGPHPEFSVVCEFCSGDRFSGRARVPNSSDTPSLAPPPHGREKRGTPWPLRHSNNRFSNRRTRTPSSKWRKPLVSRSTPA